MSIKYKKNLLYITFACRHFPLHHPSMLATFCNLYRCQIP
ncbi:hypothetical protein OIU79_013749, partial [Salix purpurea]